MQTKKRPVAAVARDGLILAAAALAFSIGGCDRSPEKEGAPTSKVTAPQRAPVRGAVKDGALAGLAFSFKLDPRLTRAQYMGDRWIAPPVYTGTVGQDTVEVSVSGIDAQGRLIPVNPHWIAADPEMVAVASRAGNVVTITVKRAGESTLKVATDKFSKDLLIKAKLVDNAMRLEISQ